MARKIPSSSAKPPGNLEPTAPLPMEEEISVKQADENLEADLKRRTGEQALTMRQTFGNWILTLVTVWLVFVGFLFWMQGTGRWNLDNSVILALIGGTTANILGVLQFVAKYLFPNQDGLPK